ncbi:MAG: sigma-54-dependent Fis family transcriptional regulator [Halieaceae bacterium]|nr:sigma-54-dependent Fis family transcriptional regulator [Halieaceae bacterium]
MADSTASCVAVGPAWSQEGPYLRQILEEAPETAVILMPAGDLTLAHLIGVTGFDAFVTYADNSDWVALVDAALSYAEAPETPAKSSPAAPSMPSIPSRGQRKQVVFSDPVSKAMLALVQRVAQVDVTALLSGPSGVGKEVVAQILHNASARASGPFIALNCSAMPEHLVESILFGHMKGSFTGAIKDQPGIFEEAHNGTLFLDEVGELPLHIQPKLLRVIQERKAARIGSIREVSFDVRLVAATNKNLVELVKRGEFREDLLYRLNAFHIGIPPLRERPEDIRQLAISFAASEQLAGIAMQIDEAAIQQLLQHQWPGNVRELDNVICRAKVLAIHNVIQPEHIYFDALEFSPASLPGAPDEFTTSDIAKPQSHEHVIQSDQDLVSAKEQAEWQLIQAALQETDSKKEAAERLGISPRTLRHKLQKLKAAEADSMQSIGAS